MPLSLSLPIIGQNRPENLPHWATLPAAPWASAAPAPAAAASAAVALTAPVPRHPAWRCARCCRRSWVWHKKRHGFQCVSMCWNVKDEVGFNFGKKGELEYWNVTEQIEMAQFAHQKCCLSPVSATPNGDFTTNLSKFHPASTQPTYGRLQCWLKMISGYVKSPGMFHLTFCSTTTNHMEVSIHGVTHKSSILKQKSSISHPFLSHSDISAFLETPMKQTSTI